MAFMMMKTSPFPNKESWISFKLYHRKQQQDGAKKIVSADGYNSEFEWSKRVPGCNRAVKQGGSKNGERENSERTFSVSARNPQGCTRPPDFGLRNGESG
jgi:hypothetical protein